MGSLGRFIALLLALLCVAPQGALSDPAPTSWSQALAQAKGQTVYFNAWGGDEQINAYHRLGGAAASTADYGITLRHVKLADTAEAVARVLAEKTAGQGRWRLGRSHLDQRREFRRDEGARACCSVPSPRCCRTIRCVDAQGKPTTAVDFTVPVDGLEAPWGMAQIVFIYDTARVSDPPREMAALLAWAEAHPGRFTYPGAAGFHRQHFPEAGAL